MGEAKRRGTPQQRRGKAIARDVRNLTIRVAPERHVAGLERNPLALELAMAIYTPHMEALHPRAGDALPPSAPAGRRPADLPADRTADTPAVRAIAG